LTAETPSPVDGILVPGGFGVRGIEGKILSARFARGERDPRSWDCAWGCKCGGGVCPQRRRHDRRPIPPNSDPSPASPVIDLLPEQNSVSDMGGRCVWARSSHEVWSPETKAYEAYGTDLISERHGTATRSTTSFRNRLVEAGLVISGTTPDGNLVEVIEAADHAWFVGCQFPSGIQE